MYLKHEYMDYWSRRNEVYLAWKQEQAIYSI
jgi:hypothetical protein